MWINGQKSIGNPRLRLKIHDFSMYYRCGRGIVPPGGIRVAEIQKRGQSKLTLQLTSFVVREMRVELTRRN